MIRPIAIVFIGTAAALRVAIETRDNGTEEGGNLCMMDRLAPKFFLLGTPKSGTTFFFEDFARSKRIVSYQPADGEPSWHSKEPWVFANGFDLSRKQSWLSHYPKCTHEKHLVAVDCTPGYFGSSPAPFAIHRVYGQAKDSLVFMVFLREPAERTHSHYYQYRENGVFDGAFKECPVSVFPKTFKQAVEIRLTKKAMCNCACDDIFDDSFYKDAFKRYFKNFASSQFHVVPFKQAVSREVVDYAWEILKVPKGTGERSSLAEGNNLENHHEYPRLHQEMPIPLKTRYMSFMYEATGPGKVAAVLAGSGAHLYGLGQAGQDKPAIASWLAKNW